MAMAEAEVTRLQSGLERLWQGMKRAGLRERLFQQPWQILLLLHLSRPA